MKKLLLLFTCMIVTLALNAQDKNVAISSATASCEQGNNPATLAVDGNFNTYWHSPWSGATFSFPVTFTIAFDEATHVDYVRYIPRQDGNNNGNWNVVYVAYCPTTDGTNFTNLGQYTLNGASLTYDFMLAEAGLECGQIKFTIESGAGSHASAAEIEAYTIDYSRQEVFAQYFADELFTELKPEVTSSEGIEDAEIKALMDNLLNDGEGYKKFRVGEYEPYMPTSTLQSILKSSSQYNNYENPTGIYLKPGETCAVMVSGIGNDPVGLKIRNWYLSEAGSSYSLRNGLNYITATTEGNVFVNYYTDNFEQAPNVKVHFINAPVQGYWDQATMTNEDWVEMLKGRSKDDNTILITRSEHAQLAYPVSAWLAYCPENVDSTMTLYQQVQWAERDIIGLEKYGRQVKNRQLYYATNYGFMAAGGDGAYCNVTSLGAIMKPDSRDFDFWGVGHEWGHNNQVTPGFKWSGCGETTNNIPASWAQFHFTGVRDAEGHPTYLRLEDEKSGVGEYLGMRGGRMQTYFEEAVRKGVAWQLQDGPDYHGAAPDEKTVAGQDANGNSIGMVTTTSRNYDHFVKLVPFWQLNLWGTVAGKSPDIIQMVIESIRSTPNYGTTYNTNGKQQINWMKLACDSTKINLLPFFEKAGMLRPIHAYIEDYGAGWNIITEAMIDKLKAYVEEQGYPAFTEEINYINGHNFHIYRDSLKLEVPTTMGRGCSVSGNKVTVQHNVVKNAVAFETYNAYGELLRITMYGLGSNDSHSFTQVLYPKSSEFSFNSAYIMAVGYDGTRTRIYEESNLDELLKDELSTLIQKAQDYLTKVDTTGTKVGFLKPDYIAELTALTNEIESMIKEVDPAEADYKGWYVQLKSSMESLLANSDAQIPLTSDCFYTIALSADSTRYITAATAGLSTDKFEEVAFEIQWRFVPAEEENTYYLQNRETGYYISTASSGSRVKAEESAISKAVVFTVVTDAPGEMYIQRADNKDIKLYNYTSQKNQLYAGNITDSRAKWILLLEDNMLGQPVISTDNLITAYYLQRTDNERYAYHVTTGRTNKGRISSETFSDEADDNYLFYFTQGSEEGKYAIYNYATGLSITANGTKLYANKEAETTVDYTLSLNEEGNGLLISSETGYWFMSASNVADLNETRSTSWKLIKKCEIIVEDEGQGVSTATSDLNIQVEDGVIIVYGLTEGVKIAVYDATGRLLGTDVATNGTAAIHAKSIEGSTVIIKVGTNSIKHSLK